MNPAKSFGQQVIHTGSKRKPRARCSDSAEESDSACQHQKSDERCYPRRTQKNSGCICHLCKTVQLADLSRWKYHQKGSGCRQVEGGRKPGGNPARRSEEHTSELQSQFH